VSAERVLARLEELYAIGGGEGANRPALSAAEQAAHDLVAGWMREAGLEVEVDGAGNLVGRRPGGEPQLLEVWTGSHLDTVPSGGRFDGALGVVAAIEALERLGPARRTAAAVAFRDEEGWRFARGFFGSRARCGLLTAADLELRDAGGTTVAGALEALGLSPARALEHAPLPGFFVELHVEQGPTLANLDVPLGVVTDIVGMGGCEVVFDGTASHAGTTPLGARADALCAAAAFVLALREAAGAEAGAVATVGALSVEPNASNVVPGRARLSVDVRSRDRAAVDRLVTAVERIAAEAAGREGCRYSTDGHWQDDPVPMDSGVRAALADAAGASAAELPSGAGHDAGILARSGVPTGMLFVRSLAGGVSHSPLEHSDADDVALAVDVLAEVLGRLSSSRP
jgi:hydantoinase/carbamoylase family amidase